MNNQKQALIVVYSSENGRDKWEPVHIDEVPEFVKEPMNMAVLLTGQQCMDAGVGDSGSKWYRAEMVKITEIRQ